MVTHLWLTHPAVVYPGSLIPMRSLGVDRGSSLLSFGLLRHLPDVWFTLPQYMQMVLPVAGCAGTRHISVAWDLVLHLLQKTCPRDSLS